MLGLEFAPFKIPLRRRLQTLAVFYFCSEFLLIGFLSTSLFVYFLFTQYYWLSLLYITWLYYDRNISYRGGRRSDLLRKAGAWKLFAEFFPIKLVKTTDLPADKNYIFGCHPHGILCFSHFVNFATEGTRFSEIFPNLLPHLITLNYQFWMPLHREIFILSGACSASRESIDYILSRKGTGNVAAIITGGAVEVLDALPNQIILTLKRRKGFVRLALKHGASLVPVISFGENELFHTMNKENSWFNRTQEKIIKILGYPIPVFYGRGIFQYSFGLLPFRKPIISIVGKPIDVAKKENPTQQEIDDLHQQYIEAVIELFEQNKNQYEAGNVTLKIK